jgi:hypothetical protein
MRIIDKLMHFDKVKKNPITLDKRTFKTKRNHLIYNAFKYLYVVVIMLKATSSLALVY